MQRIIGKYTGDKPGPLIVITAAMHGNEPAGVKALDLLFKMLEVEPITRPGFSYRGEIIGILGNISAFSQQKRYIKKDINRCWYPEYIAQLLQKDKNDLKDEDFEIRDILDTIGDEIDRLKPSRLFLLDLHLLSLYSL